MRRCKVSEAVVALAFIGQGGKLHNKQGARSRGPLSSYLLALSSLLLTILKAFLKALQYSATVSSFD